MYFWISSNQFSVLGVKNIAAMMRFLAWIPLPISGEENLQSEQQPVVNMLEGEVKLELIERNELLDPGRCGSNYPRPVLLLGIAIACVCVCVNHKLVRAITYHITLAMPRALIQVCCTPLCMVQRTHLITTGGTPHLYNRGSSMLVNSLHSGENNM